MAPGATYPLPAAPAILATGRSRPVFGAPTVARVPAADVRRGPSRPGPRRAAAAGEAQRRGPAALMLVGASARMTRANSKQGRTRVSAPFKGIVNLDIRDSTPDWEPFEPPKAPDGAPSVIYVVLDDVGFSALGCYGGPVDTPNIDRLAADGVRYTQWHTTALCSPTRSCLLTGRNHTRNSMACITEAAIGFPNASGTIPPENGMLSEILGELGWNTYMVGKWHLCPEDEMNLASTRRNWPSGRGFERSYGFLGAETNQWYPDLFYDNHLVDQPRSPEEGYHLTVDVTDKAIEFIRDAKVIAPEKPFFLYYAPGACHAPHHAPKEWIEKYKGRFDMGYEAMREQTLARQKNLGIVPPDTELPPINPIGTPETRTGPDGKPFPMMDVTRPWDSLSDEEKQLFCRMAEVYAGFLAHADDQLGRLLGFLEEFGWRENTLVILVSDNGASGEGGPNGSVNEMKFANGLPDNVEENLPLLDELGGTKTYNHYPNGWAMAFNTPFKMWKRYEFNGGTSDPCIVSWPAGIEGPRRDPPPVPPCDRPRPDGPRRARRRVAAVDQGARAEPVRRRQHALQPRRRLGADGAPVAVLRDAGLPRDLARRLEGGHEPPHARRLEQLQRRRVGAVPHRGRPLRAAQPRGRTPRQGARARQPVVLGGRRQRRVPPRRPLRAGDHPHPAPGAVPAAQPVRVLPAHGRGAGVAGGQRPQPLLRHRGLVDIPAPGAEGVLFAHGSLFGGHALYVKDNRLHYVYNFVGMAQQHVVASEDIPTGENLILSASFDKEGEDPPGVAVGTLSAVARRHEGRRGAASRPSPASSRSAARGSASGATAAPASPPTTRGRAVGLHRRHDPPRRRRRER